MFEVCLYCVAAEVLGITVTEVLGIVLAQVLTAACEELIEDCTKDFVLKL